MSDHLTPTMTDRGFRHLPSIPDAYGLAEARVYESSSAEGAHLWLGIVPHPSQPKDPDGCATVHLTAEAAWQLKEQIEHLLAHHYQGDARPGASDGDDWCPACGNDPESPTIPPGGSCPRCGDEDDT